MRKETVSIGAQFVKELLKEPEILEALAPFFSAIGTRIAEQTADRIQSHHSHALLPQKDAVVPVSDCCKMLKCSKPTFKKHFLDTGKLHLVPAPANADKRAQYVSAKEFQKIIKAVPMQVVRINKAA